MKETFATPAVGAIIRRSINNEPHILIQTRNKANDCGTNGLLEIPAGKREKGEEPFVTAQRELKEEVGATAREWVDLGKLIPSPGCYGETLYMYLARGLDFGEVDPDEDEFLECERLPFEELYRMCKAEVEADK